MQIVKLHNLAVVFVYIQLSNLDDNYKNEAQTKKFSLFEPHCKQNVNFRNFFRFSSHRAIGGRFVNRPYIGTSSIFITLH